MGIAAALYDGTGTLVFALAVGIGWAKAVQRGWEHLFEKHDGPR